jgi:hypothetical protein
VRLFGYLKRNAVNYFWSITLHLFNGVSWKALTSKVFSMTMDMLSKYVAVSEAELDEIYVWRNF